MDTAHTWNGPTIAFDLETLGLDPWAPNARIRMASISHRTGWAQCIPANTDSTFPEWLVKILEDPRIRKVGSNISFDYKWMRRFGVEMQNFADTATAEHVICETSPSKSLKVLTLIYHENLGDYSAPIQDLIAQRGGNMDLLEDHEMYSYSAADSDASITVYNKQIQILEQKKLRPQYELLMELYQILPDISHAGACISLEENARLSAAYQEEISSLRTRLTEVFGPINVRSRPQLIKALKEVVPDVNLWSKKKVYQWNGEDLTLETALELSESTARKILEREAIKHRIIGTILEYRRREKLYSVYVEGLKGFARQAPGGFWFVRPDFRTDRTETYRLASRDPNGQNIPRNLPANMSHLNIKDQFVSRFPGGVIGEVDQSQIELREGAMIADDASLMAAFITGGDVHSQVAATLYGKSIEQIDRDLRQTAKTLNFRIFYGGGPGGLARELGIEYMAAKRLIAQYFARFTGIAEYMERQKAAIKRDLQVVSRFGFPRRVVAPRSWESPEGWHLERQAINAPIQNGAFMITACGMIKAWHELRKRKMQTKMFLNVHDSAVFDSPAEEAEEAKQIFVRCFENPEVERYGVQLTVPLKVDYKSGSSWGKAK